MKIDINCDLGESFGNYRIGNDEEVLKHITSANIACGWHAGDPMVMDKTIALAKANKVSIGAHPGFNDLQGFGRREIKLDYDEMRLMVKYQIGALQAMCKSHGVNISHVKPHGAMYNMASKDPNYALAIVKAIKEVDDGLILLGLSASELIKQAVGLGLNTANEVFADRAYDDNGKLVSRSVEGAVIHDPKLAVDRALKMIKEGRVMSIQGKEIPIKADSICVHGDNAKAVDFVKLLKDRFEVEGIAVAAINQVIK